MDTINEKFQTRSLSSLAKVFADEEIKDPTFTKGTALLNETYAFQVAYKGNDSELKYIKVSAEGDLENSITVRSVGLIQSDFPMYDDHDEHILRSTPGLYPDPLYPLDEDELENIPNQWNS